MRVISGEAGGVPLKVPKDVTRPTTDRVRGALFSSLGQLLEGARVLDLFAGSGSLGLEALSRGADTATFVEQNREASRIIEGNLSKTRLETGKVINRDCLDFLRTAQPDAYDLVFADPPYAKRRTDTDFGPLLLDSADLDRITTERALLILEVPHPHPVCDSEFWEEIDARNYGSCGIRLLQKVATSAND